MSTVVQICKEVFTPHACVLLKALNLKPGTKSGNKTWATGKKMILLLKLGSRCEKKNKAGNPGEKSGNFKWTVYKIDIFSRSVK